jgi:hypothetical protein
MKDLNNSLPQLAYLALAACVACSNPATSPGTSTGGQAGAGSLVVGAAGKPAAAPGSTVASPGGATAAGNGNGNGTAASASGTAPTGSTGNSAAAGSRASTSAAASGGAGASSKGPGVAATTPPVPQQPTKRSPKYKSLAPALGMPLPRMNMGMWNYTDVEGAISRDGSPAGFYYKYSATGSKNLLVYLVGGGVCPDRSFCNINPANRNQSLTAEGIGAGFGNALLAAPDTEPQDPNLARWQSGIFKDDPTNPTKDWNVVFIPYVTGDVFFGSHPNATIPDVDGTFQFVGKSNMQKFFERIIPTFADAEIAMMAGSSAGGIGTLLNATYFADGFIDQGKGARVIILDDAGPFFEDEYLDVCIQQRYRELFGLNASFPEDCPDCVSENGGGLAKGILTYLTSKYPGQALGGLVDSNEDEIMKFFFSEGLEKCSYIDNPVTGLLAYPAGQYPKALESLLKIVPPDVMASYIWEGTLHQNVFQTASGDRFYEKNGLDKTVAEWLTGLINGQSERMGVVK